MKRWEAITTAMALLCGADAAQAQSKSANELARQCIADNKSACSQYIIGSVESLEKDRRARGEPTCLTGDPSSEQIVKVFVRAMLANYPYPDLAASAAIETIYKDRCKGPN